jgi:hypothetical protein
MSRLAIKNAHGRDSSIQFEESSHTYTVKGTSKGYISVTKLIHAFFPEFNAPVIIQKMMAGKNWSSHKHFGKTAKEIAALWKKDGRESSEAGTKLHLAIELFLDAYPDPVPSPTTIEWSYFQTFWATLGPDLEPYRLEWPVWVEELKLAGAIDCVFRRKSDGAFLIYDWKRSKEIKMENDYENGLGPLSHLPASNYWQYTIQLNLYRWILENHYGLSIEGMYLIVLHPDNKTYRRYPLNRLDDEINEILEARRVGLERGLPLWMAPSEEEGCSIQLPKTDH